MLRKYGSDVVNDLETREKLTRRWTDDELADIRMYFKQKIADLNNGIAPEYSNEPLSVSSLWADVPLTDSVSALSLFDPAVHAENDA